ncbi:unnamed protein product [Gadus morhua 'NCC']
MTSKDDPAQHPNRFTSDPAQHPNPCISDPAQHPNPCTSDRVQHPNKEVEFVLVIRHCIKKDRFMFNELPFHDGSGGALK